MVKNLSTIQETQVQSLGWENPLKKGMVTSRVFLPGKSMDRRVCWAIVHGFTESDTAE